jgi:hypothetical protein
MVYQEFQLPFHFVATPDLGDKLSLEDVGVRVQVSKLNEAEFAEFRNAFVSGFGLQNNNSLF